MDSTMKGSQMKSQYKSSMMGNDVESQQKRCIKKILHMSSMDQEIMKILRRIFEGGVKYLTNNTTAPAQTRGMDGRLIDPKNQEPKEIKGTKTQLLEYSKSILDKDRQKKLQDLIRDLEGGDDSHDTFLKIIKFYVLSPVETDYIEKIEKELKRAEELDLEIKEVEEQVESEQKQKIDRYLEEKEGQAPSNNKETCEALLRQISLHENKLEKANQKLNDIVANNNQLREQIDVLRKEKNMIEEIYQKLNAELEAQKQNVQATIISAGDAYYKRNIAQEELQQLQEQAEKQKDDFEQQCKQLNEHIQYDRRFKQFIKGKQKEKQTLEKLEKQIKQNQEIIKEKVNSNAKIDNEYNLSAQKEEEIKKAFERIKQQTQINQTQDQESKELLNVFINLYQKNTIMSQFVKQLNEEVQELEKQIDEKQKQIQLYNTKGATNDNQRREMKIELTNKIQQEEKQKAILQAQYQKSIETINLIKSYLENVFTAIEVEPEIIEQLRNAAITQENMAHFLGILEQKGLDAISEYARLIAEQLKLEKGEVPGLTQQIDDLNNIIAYENANIMNYYSENTQQKEEVDQALLDEYNDVNQETNNFITQQEHRKAALDLISNQNQNAGGQQQAKNPTKAIVNQK